MATIRSKSTWSRGSNSIKPERVRGLIRSIITLLCRLNGRTLSFPMQKGALVPQWDESACFRGATHFQRPVETDRPFAFCCGKGTAPVSGPAGGAVFALSLPWNAFSRRRSSLSGGAGGYLCPVMAVSVTILSHSGEKVNRFPRFLRTKGGATEGRGKSKE